MARLTISNEFTGMSIAIDDSQLITRRKITAWRQRLCSANCISGDELGGRGRQEDMNAYDIFLQRAQRVVATGRDETSVEPVKPRVRAGYVLCSNGDILAQIPEDNQYGFSLLSDDQSYPGGIGCGSRTWRLLPDDHQAILRSDREKLGWIIEQTAVTSRGSPLVPR